MTDQSLPQPVAATPSRSDPAPPRRRNPRKQLRWDLYGAVVSVFAAFRAWLGNSDRMKFVQVRTLRSRSWWKRAVRAELIVILLSPVFDHPNEIPNLRLRLDQAPPIGQLLLGILALFVMVGSLWFAAGRIVAGLLGAPRFGVRLLARLIACTWLLSVGFNLLINLGRFRLLDATCLLLLVAGACALFLPKPGPQTSVLAYALRVTRRHAPAYIGLGALLLLLLLRCLTQVPLAWDTLNYHAIKSALWVQTGAHIDLDMPGAWSIYRYFPLGGEALSAWAMLPFHSDLLYGALDFAFWCGLGVALYEIARELGARGWGRLLATTYLLFLPASLREVGSGYVETSLDFALFGSAFMLIRYLKTRRGGYLVAGAMAMGVALAIKTTAITYVGVWVLVVLGSILARRQQLRPALRVLGGAAVCGCLVYLPSVVHLALETGYPLGTVPVSVAGVPLGKMTDSARFGVDRPIDAYEIGAELIALAQQFAPPWEQPRQGTFSCSAASLLPMLIGAITLALPRSRGVASRVLLPIVLVTVFNVYQPAFSFVRLYFAQLNGRFFFPLVAVLVLYAVAYARPRRLAIALNVYLLVATGVHVCAQFFYGWSDVDKMVVVLLALLTGYPVLLIGRWKPRALRPALAVLTAVTLIAAAYWKDSDRVHFLRCSQAVHPVPNYWLPAVEALQRQREPLRIAITAGMWQNAGNQFFYHFMGQRLQNTLYYIPLTEDGHIVPQTPEYVDTPLSFEAWRRRLIENKITHVITLTPASVELRWMKQAPKQFHLVAGRPGRAAEPPAAYITNPETPGDEWWGLFEFRCPPAQKQVAPVAAVGQGPQDAVEH